MNDKRMQARLGNYNWLTQSMSQLFESKNEKLEADEKSKHI